MANKIVSRVRYGEAFWRAHHEGWCRSDLNPTGALRTADGALPLPDEASGDWPILGLRCSVLILATILLAMHTLPVAIG